MGVNHASSTSLFSVLNLRSWQSQDDGLAALQRLHQLFRSCYGHSLRKEEYTMSRLWCWLLRGLKTLPDTCKVGKGVGARGRERDRREERKGRAGGIEEEMVTDLGWDGRMDRGRKGGIEEGWDEGGMDKVREGRSKKGKKEEGTIG